MIMDRMYGRCIGDVIFPKQYSYNRGIPAAPCGGASAEKHGEEKTGNVVRQITSYRSSVIAPGPLPIGRQRAIASQLHTHQRKKNDFFTFCGKTFPPTSRRQLILRPHGRAGNGSNSHEHDGTWVTLGNRWSRPRNTSKGLL